MNATKQTVTSRSNIYQPITPQVVAPINNTQSQCAIANQGQTIPSTNNKDNDYG